MTRKEYIPQEIARLILACLHQEAQEAELQEWLDENEENRLFYQKICSEAYLQDSFREYINYDSHKDWKKVKAKIKPEHTGLLRRLLPYAAIFSLLIGTAFIVKYKKVDTVPQQITTNKAILPGASKARLILPNGLQIGLGGEGDSLCCQMAGENFVNDGEQLVYEKQDIRKKARLHTLQIPRGGEYKLLLADGTQVWLNAETELTYPDFFSGDSRRVKLVGEAYFEVTKDPSRPFYVQVGDMEVKVLGTAFNISAYPGNRRQTTLAEGKVAIRLQQQQLEIQPGQQATETTEGLKITRVNVANYTGWKERRFVYKDKLLEEVLQDMERWYDVEIFIVSNEIRHLHLTADLPKYENIDKVLEIIEYAACVKFEVKGKTIVVNADK